MKIAFTKHAEKKFKELPLLNITVKKADIIKAIKNPDYIDVESDKPKIIVHGPLNSKHIVRVVYKQESGIITVITFYPARRKRYEK